MNNQFKFKPDKNKYLSNVDTLDSSHKKITEEFFKKRYEVDKKKVKLSRLKSELEEIDNKQNNLSNIPNYIEVRAKLIDEISNLKDEIEEINNYQDETEYYSKTYNILFNYYDILDGQIESEIKNQSENINKKPVEINNISNTNDVSNVDVPKNNNLIDEWDLDGNQIFNLKKKSTLDLLNELAKKNKKEKKITRRRIKNVESLIKNNNYDIFEFINTVNKNDINTKNKKNDINEYSVFDRAQLYDDYKITLEGYNSKKKISKMCVECETEKVLIYSEGIYACLNCGDVENCIIENEITNYKEPMVEKPTFPYKRKNHFCEWTCFKIRRINY